MDEAPMVERTVELDEWMDRDLRSLAAFAGMTPEETVYQAVAFYLHERSAAKAEFDRSVREAIEESDANPESRVDGEIVSAWLQTWGDTDAVDLDEFIERWQKERAAA